MLDRIAYHHLIGVDCFVFVLDQRRSLSRASLELLMQLRRRPDLVALLPFDTNQTAEHRLMDASAGLLHYLRIRRLPVEHYAYIDGDEYLVPVDAASPSDAVVLPPLRHMLRGADALYLHRWDFGGAGYARLEPAQLSQQPLFAWLTSRDGEQRRACVGKTAAIWGKMLGRVDSGWRPQTMHGWAGGRMALPNGRPYGPYNTAGTPDPCEAQPLTIFHFLGTLADCSRKARLGAPASHGFVNQRREDRCRQRHADETSGAVRVVQDRTLARYANATRTHALELFGMQPADLARLMSLYANV